MPTHIYVTTLLHEYTYMYILLQHWQIWIAASIALHIPRISYSAANNIMIIRHESEWATGFLHTDGLLGYPFSFSAHKDCYYSIEVYKKKKCTIIKFSNDFSLHCFLKDSIYRFSSGRISSWSLIVLSNFFYPCYSKALAMSWSISTTGENIAVTFYHIHVWNESVQSFCANL